MSLPFQWITLYLEFDTNWTNEHAIPCEVGLLFESIPEFHIVIVWPYGCLNLASQWTRVTESMRKKKYGMVTGVGWWLKNQDQNHDRGNATMRSDFEHKTQRSECSDFKITNSRALNNIDRDSNRTMRAMHLVEFLSRQEFLNARNSWFVLQNVFKSSDLAILSLIQWNQGQSLVKIATN